MSWLSTKFRRMSPLLTRFRQMNVPAKIGILTSLGRNREKGKSFFYHTFGGSVPPGGSNAILVRSLLYGRSPRDPKDNGRFFPLAFLVQKNMTSRGYVLGTHQVHFTRFPVRSRRMSNRPSSQLEIYIRHSNSSGSSFCGTNHPHGTGTWYWYLVGVSLACNNLRFR